jgi:endonuclease YncB( thermonuclease family)
MMTLCTTLTQVVGMMLLLSVCEGLAAEPKAWEKLTDCQYVPHAYNDGDSFHVKCGTDEFIVRLYFVDAPEADTEDRQRSQEQTEYFGVTLENNIRAGVKARDAVNELLRAAPFVVWTRRASAGGRSKQLRYYGLVEVGSKGLAEILVSKGLARTKGVRANLPSGEKSKEYEEKLRGLESDAKEKRVGIWEHSRVE